MVVCLGHETTACLKNWAAWNFLRPLLRHRFPTMIRAFVVGVCQLAFAHLILMAHCGVVDGHAQFPFRRWPEVKLVGRLTRLSWY
jgi:hypothetical protein